MPQLDTSTWLTMILSIFLTLFIIFQLKVSKHNFYHNPELTPTKILKQNTLRNKMNENLFTSFITPVILGLPLVTLIVLFPSLLFPTSNRLVSNRFVTLQQWILQLVSKQIMSIHNSKGQTWTLILISLILFIGSTNLLGLLPHSFTPTTQLSINLGIAIPCEQEP